MGEDAVCLGLKAGVDCGDVGNGRDKGSISNCFLTSKKTKASVTNKASSEKIDRIATPENSYQK
ncbi:hypothetical protein [Polaromonas vacuolata]|uniref:hypothetical protein n=1 Tax=Polaromonas vacuolata TaxID=37448 RepID=UPI001456A8EE|nr:hypothetical protein [Polaromonas vacuolata]